jgi:hypothetical protein
MSKAKTASLNIILGDPNQKFYKKKSTKRNWYHPSPLKDRKALTSDKNKEDLTGYTLDFRKGLPALGNSSLSNEGNKQLLDEPIYKPVKVEEKNYTSLPAILNRSTSIAKILDSGRKFLEQDTSFNTSRDFQSHKNRSSSTNPITAPRKNYWNPRPLGRYSEAMAIRKYNKEIADKERSQNSFNVRLDSEIAETDFTQSQFTKTTRKVEPTFVSETELAEFNFKRLANMNPDDYAECPPLDMAHNNIYKIHAMQKQISMSKILKDVSIGKVMLKRESKLLSPVKISHLI